MTLPDLPRPVTTDQKLLTAVVRRLDDQNELLAQILDRLPRPLTVAQGQTVELREPSVQTPEAKPAAGPSPTPPPATARSARKTTPKTKPKGS